MLKHLLYLCLGAGLLACSSVSHIYSSAEKVEVNDAYSQSTKIDSIVQPYRAELAAEMQEVIAQAEHDFFKDRPNGALNNWAADAALNSVQKESDEALFCLLNVGGLRNPISKGDVTLGDIYKLMPFDNEVVIVELKWERLQAIQEYLIVRGGEPVAGVQLVNQELIVNSLKAQEYVDEDGILIPVPNPKTFKVVTSDYLMNGGDNMTFFADPVNVQYTGNLLRDVFIEQAKQQQVLIWTDEKRIQL